MLRRILLFGVITISICDGNNIGLVTHSHYGDLSHTINSQGKLMHDQSSSSNEESSSPFVSLETPCSISPDNVELGEGVPHAQTPRLQNRFTPIGKNSSNNNDNTNNNNPFLACIHDQSHRIKRHLCKQLETKSQAPSQIIPQKQFNPSSCIQKSILQSIHNCNIMNQYHRCSSSSKCFSSSSANTNNILCSNSKNQLLFPFIGGHRGLLGNTIAAKIHKIPPSLRSSTRRNCDDDHDGKDMISKTTNVSTQTTKNNMMKMKKKRRKNNTGFYYGIQDDVFFRDKIDNDEKDKRNKGDNNKSGIDSSSFQQQQQQLQRRPPPPTSSSITTSEGLGEIMGETLLELREMREDIMALREEMHYMKEEMRRNNQMRSSTSPSTYYGDDDINEENLDEMESSSSGSVSMTQTMKRRKEFDFISKDVEKWAHKLLFEENGEENGWKEVNCNKMVRSKFNKDGTTKCFIKWMKDSRRSNPNDYTNDKTEYPCIKCYSTINAPIDKVCDYLSQESNMPQYNDLVISYKDLEDIGPQSKICWSQCPQILFIKPRDFVTFCHFRWRKDGTQIVVNQACEHESAPGNEDEGDGKICRAHALRGANFISKDPDDPTKTRMAILAHANPGGGVPQWAMKTAVNAVAPIEPFKLFHKIDTCVRNAHKENNGNKASMVSSTPGRKRPAGLSQLGYACFWPVVGDVNDGYSMELEQEYITSDYF